MSICCCVHVVSPATHNVSLSSVSRYANVYREKTNAPDRAQRRLFADVRVGVLHEPAHVGREVARHGRGADVAERREREADRVGRARVVEVHLEAVGHEHEHLVALVEQDHEPQVPDALFFWRGLCCCCVAAAF